MATLETSLAERRTQHGEIALLIFIELGKFRIDRLQPLDDGRGHEQRPASGQKRPEQRRDRDIHKNRAAQPAQASDALTNWIAIMKEVVRNTVHSRP